eukprot:gnl/MRDRNA2_/MRDRNA2_95167_c0_seq1.p1 gnl/MRDRNA2_/MRDRNA2_95167_c0~~gnl/MRDRNA2_/MRDRNA2_95167_c0_seq1.p1  ORF type:complete len:111 (+),score=18.75 gnl/MRDRNA2_/MRDRNA2_95167_c0_seq1:85-417(+)
MLVESAATHSRPSLYFALFLAAALFITEHFGRAWMVDQIVTLRWAMTTAFEKEVPLVEIPQKSFAHGVGAGTCKGSACYGHLERLEPTEDQASSLAEVGLSGGIQMQTLR